ncbi:MAG: Asp-tRNA(Asn)/Glu-tRNA(Gln) amidotransferase subunit GatC [Fibrobacterota bacterium]
MALTEKDVQHISELARLTLTEDEKGLYLDQLNSVLDYMEKLGEADTDGVEPTSAVTSGLEKQRDDVLRPSLDKKEILKNAPETEDGFFSVPRVIG